MSDELNKIRKEIYETLELAQVSMSDFARVTKVSRETLYRWKNGGNVTDKIRWNMVVIASRRIRAALDSKELPLRDKMPYKEKTKIVNRIVNPPRK